MNTVLENEFTSAHDLGLFIEDLKASAKGYGLDPERLVKKIEDKKLDILTARQESLIYSLGSIDMSAPNWTYMATKYFFQDLYEQASKNRGYDSSLGYGDYFELVKTLTEKGLYSNLILTSYTEEEIREAASVIDKSRDHLFNFIGAFLIADRYIARDHDKGVWELPQERWLTIALVLMSQETENRLDKVKEHYWALSNLFMTVATPTLANAGKSHGQLSSCFIDTVDDSLDGIYLNNYDVATLSKNGGGLGVYFGKVRALASDIKKFKGKSSGIVPWIKLLNNTAVSVDQLGQRQGAIAVYLDVFHKDILRFCDLRLNNGDDRLRAHDIFTGVCIPDLFMEQLKVTDENGRSIGEWNLFCPYEVKKFMGWKDENGNPLGLEDFYDEKDVRYFKEKYEEAVNHPLLPRTKVRAMDIMSRIMRSQLETGMPFMFYRDEANRMNPMKKEPGRTTIYSSNLCTEIMQSMSPTLVTRKYYDENLDEIVIARKPGDFVVCNLASLNLARIFYHAKGEVLRRVVRIAVRGLDNVIDLNTIEVLQAQVTNQRYRGIGLGTFGWHHLIALKGIYWESQEAVDYSREIYEQIAYEAIKASADLAIEKGAFKLFAGSEWETGEFFDRRPHMKGDKWNALREQIKETGIRNAWLMAIAPNSSTAKIANSSDGIDPIFNVEFAEEKKNFKFKVTAPDLDHNNYEYYRKNGYFLDQHWSIRHNEERAKWIDQGISFNLYVLSSIKAKELLDLHFHAWESRIKTTYYVRSTTLEELKSCEACQ